MTAQPAPASSEVRDVFLSDHRRLDALFEELVAAFEANDREEIGRLWAVFEAGLTAHMEAEEKVLIPALSRTNPQDARAILAEHRHIRGRLAELGPCVDLHVVRLDVARAFIDELKAHARHEDRSLYLWADEHLGDTERASLFSSLRNAVRTKAREVLGESKAKAK